MAYQGAHTGPEIDDGVGAAKGNSAGIMVKTGTGAGVRRTITGSEYVAVSDGNGVNAAPHIDLTSAAKTKVDGAVQREAGVNYGWIHISQTDYEALVSAGTQRTDVQYLVDDEL